MTANSGETENDLLVWAVDWLRGRLPPQWEVDVSNWGPTPTPGSDNAAVEVRASNVRATLAVETKRTLAPRDVDRLLGGVGRTLRALAPHVPILVVASWLSSRTRQLLSSEGINYLDQTGNASIRLDNPALFIQTEGAARDPSPGPRSKARVRGPKAGRLLRTLVDSRPPYGVRDLAEATGLAPGYVSRLLDALHDDALVERTRRGGIERVDIAGVLRRWAESYDVFKANEATAYLAPQGAAEALSRLTEGPVRADLAVTGSFAAVLLGPVAAPTLLAVYSEEPGALADRLGLLPADVGANVVLLRPFDPIVWERTQERGGMRYVAPSQTVIDCLTGNGRMPSEGEAVLSWMLANESEWRQPALTRRSSLASGGRPE